MALARARGPGGFLWNETLGRYIDPRGRIVSLADVRRGLDAALEEATRRTRALGEALQRGDISADAFYTAMRREVKQVHLYSAAAAKGGWAQMTPADYGRVGRQLRDEYAYLDRFAGEIAAGLPMNGMVTARAEQYAQAGRNTYDKTQTRAMRERGMTEERNILHPADHCDECLELTDRGWVPLGSLPPIGQRVCRRKCKCTKEFR